MHARATCTWAVWWWIGGTSNVVEKWVQCSFFLRIMPRNRKTPKVMNPSGLRVANAKASSVSVGGLKDVQEVRDQLIFQSDSTKSIDWQQVGATHWEPPLEPAHGGKNISPNVLKSLYICKYYAGISGSEQKTSSLSESIDKNTSAEKHSGKEN
uniref:Uncharacterized protein n=1 Tax=Vitis vinifera TaxID=29760 RepID=A5AQI2_VITVI|nr:hypothetical protein VITISV_020783 [Vitis vinifera]